jgi:hypothetical protein
VGREKEGGHEWDLKFRVEGVEGLPWGATTTEEEIEAQGDSRCHPHSWRGHTLFRDHECKYSTA